MTHTYQTPFGAVAAAHGLDFIADSTRDAGLTGSAAEVAAALRDAPRRYQELGRQRDELLRLVAGNTSLSDEGKTAARAKVLAGWQRDAGAVVADARDRAANARIRRETDVRPAPVHIDPTVAEARLGNARLDAQMILDPTEPPSLPAALEGLARSEDAPAVRHLVLVGPWTGLYLKARGLPHEAAEWEANRRGLWGPLLDAKGRTALTELDALADVLDTPLYLERLYTADASGYGLWVG